MNLDDGDLGLLTGFAFAIFYVTLGLPIARIADKTNRKNVVSISLVIWSSMTAFSGLVANYWQLLLARIGVGIGEAGGSPPSHSMISDYFPPEKRATALSIYSGGLYFGILVGGIGGSIIGQTFGWRIAFLSMGIPGIIYALLVYFTIKEPLKGGLDKNQAAEESNFWVNIKMLLGKPTFILLSLACGAHAFSTYGIGNFIPSFFIRVHGFSISNAGLVYALGSGFGGMVGSFLGGFITDKMKEKSKFWYFGVPIMAGLINLIPTTIFIFHPNGSLVAVMAFFTSLTTAIFLGPMITVTHSLVSAKMRSFASAIFFFILNLIGLGLGPWTIGLISEALKEEYGAESLRYAFIFTYFVGAIALTLFFLASRYYQKDLDKMQATAS